MKKDNRPFDLSTPDLTGLKTTLQEISDELMCEVHPYMCDLRDHQYPRFEELVLQQALGDESSLQAAISFLESELNTSGRTGEQEDMILFDI